MILDPTNETKRAHVLSLSLDELTARMAEMGEKPFRAKQIDQWIFDRAAASYGEMTNLSKPLRDALARSFDLFQSRIHRRAVSQDGTIKLLLQWSDGAVSECVMIPTERGRASACISSQVGCPVGCRFCASGLDGLQRNLTTGEIVEQVLRLKAESQSCDRNLTNIVFMGMGEPLANYPMVMKAIQTINAPWGVNIGARRITLSTVGLPKQIRKLATEGLQLNLALSLHAPNDRLRRELIPWAQRISMDELSKACQFYFRRTGREITLEYVLLNGVNDLPPHARELAQFAHQFRCNVNLIRYHPVSTLPYRRPSGTQAHLFQETLRNAGVNSHIRRSRGMDIDAACGQLRRRDQMEDDALRVLPVECGLGLSPVDAPPDPEPTGVSSDPL